MKKAMIHLAFLAFGYLITGCAAPGSAMCQNRVKGRLFDHTGQALANQQVDILLPSQYGLAGLDAVWGKPEDYGRRDQKATLTTDETGRFEYEFMPTTYSIAFFIIPPLGPLPRKPPEPYFYLKFPSQTDEFWVLWVKEEGLEVKAIERGNPTPLDQSTILPADFSGELIWEPEDKPRGYLVDFEMNLLSKPLTKRANHSRH